MKKGIKSFLVLFSVVGLFGIAGTLEYSDLVGQPIGNAEGIWMLVKYSVIPYGISKLL